jgi:hypothetical protein
MGGLWLRLAARHRGTPIDNDYYNSSDYRGALFLAHLDEL